MQAHEILQKINAFKQCKNTQAGTCLHSALAVTQL